MKLKLYRGCSYTSVDSTTPGQDLVRDSNNQVIAVIAFYRLGLFGICQSHVILLCSPFNLGFLPGHDVKENGDLNAGLRVSDVLNT